MKSYKKDGILVGILFLCAGLSSVFLNTQREVGAYVRIEQNGEILQYLPLSENVEWVFSSETAGQEGENVIVIESGKVWIREADCPDKICVNQGEKSQVGDTIVCLPHRLVLTIIGEEEFPR